MTVQPIFYQYLVPQAKAVCVLAHGAGAGCDHPFFEQLVQYLNQQQLSVVLFDFPYMQKRKLLGTKRPPDRLPILLSHYHQIIELLMQEFVNIPVLIGGKSMGSRVAATLLSSEEFQQSTAYQSIAGLVCLGYPFHPIGKPENLRLQPLQQLKKPTLIVQGERDKLGDKPEVVQYHLPEQVMIHWLAAADHDLKPLKLSGYSHQQHLATAATVIRHFVEQLHE
jgi:hypothetical protein